MKKIAIFGSGKGSNAKNLINYFKSHKHIMIELIVTNNPKSGIVDIANEAKINLFFINKSEFILGEATIKKLKFHKISFIVLAGFLLKVPKLIINNFSNKILNIHPALLPKFGGKGMYGIHVHNAVLEASETVSGITIHYVNNEYDKGNIIFQAKCNILQNDSAKLLSKKIQQLEYQFYPMIIEKAINNEY